MPYKFNSGRRCKFPKAIRGDQPLRQTQGFARSLLKLMGLELPVLDLSTLSRRATGLAIEEAKPKSTGPITLIVDSTGLKTHRGSGWQEERHGAGRTRKS